MRQRKTSVTVETHISDEALLPLDTSIAISHMPLNIGKEFEVCGQFVLFCEQKPVQAQTGIRIAL